MKNKIMLLVFVVINIRFQFSQQEAMLSQYMNSVVYINPAFSGSRNYGEINGIVRKQWVNFEGAPLTQFLSAEGPVKNKNMGWGGIIVNDKIGVSCRTDFHLNYAYQIKTGKNNHLALGIRGGASYLRADLTDLRVWDSQDQIFSTNLKDAWLPNAGFGLHYYGNKLFAGLSCPNLVDYSNSSISKGNYPRLKPHYYFTSSYNFRADIDVNVKTSLLIKYVPFAPFQADLNLMSEIKNRLFVGVSYRSGDGIIPMLQIVFAEQWRVGYAFDYPITRIKNYSSGSHELMLSYRFNIQPGTNNSTASF